MAAPGKFYGKAPLSWFNKEMDWPDDDWRAVLTTSTEVPDQDVDDYLDDIVANEISGTGYTAGGQALANKTITYTAATNVTKLDCDDPSWPSSTLSDVKNFHIVDRTPATDATRPLLVYGINDTALNTSNGTLAIQLDAAGLATLTAA